MKQFGLIGYPLSHSFSKNYFSKKFQNEHILDSEYEVYPLKEIEDFLELCIQQNKLVGLNVTIPYKEKVIAYLDDLSEEAKQINAVNTIKFIEGKKIGYNTDCYGFERSLQPLLQSHHKNALILGTGGASKAVEFVLKKLGIGFQYVSRKASEKSIAYAALNEEIMQSATLIFNCTPIGMYPAVEAAPEIPYQFITEKHLLYDLVYNPEVTLFLKNGKENGAQIKNGLEMLHLQAEKSWEIWNS